MKENTRVCIIGAGLSGLVTAKVLKADGFNVTIFEKESTPGGVWVPSRTYAGLCVQNPKKAYAFSDFPYPETSDEFPTARQAFEYLSSYAQHFGLETHLNLSTEVLSVALAKEKDRDSHPGFRVTFQPVNNAEDKTTQAFDFLVICNGVFSKPFIPQVEGRDLFKGSVIHSSHMVDRQMLKGKHVVVVGAGKSALDCASVAAHEAESSTLVFRSPHWILPRYFPDGKRVEQVIGTRLSEKFLPAYYRASLLEKTIRVVAAPLLWLWRRVMSRMVSRASGMPPDMVPEKPVTSGGENLGIGARFYRDIKEGLAQTRRASIKSFSGPDTLQLSTGDEIKADLIIFATGWQQDVSILDPELHAEVWRNGKFHLYRHILPPGEHRLGFIGYASAGNNALTSEISAHWLSECFLGNLKLPDVEKMEQEIGRLHRWASKVFPKRKEGYFVGGYVPSYVDELMKDMKLPTRRTGSFYAEYFKPAFADRYEGIGEERRRIREKLKT